MKHTQHYKLKKPEPTVDYFDKEHDNSNMDVIDGKLHEHEARVVKIEGKLDRKENLSIQLGKDHVKVKSVTDSYGGVCRFEVEGALVDNIFNKALEKDMNPHKYNYVLVELGKPYVFKNPTDSNIDLYYGEEGILTSPIGYVPPKGILKLTPVNAKISMYLSNGLGKTFGETMVVQGVDEPLGYFEGLQSLRGVAVEAVGKNLFDKNKANLKGYYNDDDIFKPSQQDSSTDFIAIKENTTYFQNDGTSQYVNFYDNNFKFLRNEATNRDGVTGRFQSRLGDAYIRLSFRTNQLETYMVTEGYNRLVDYNSYKSSKIVLDDPLAKLPNGATDKIVRENGKTVKYVNTNMGRDKGFYKLMDEDFVGLYTGGTNVNLVQLDLTKLSDYRVGTTGIDGIIRVEGFSGETGTLGSNYDLTTSIGKIAIATSQYWLIVSKADVPDLATAKSKYIGKKVAYQLANSQIIELSDNTEPVISQEGYTQFNVEDGVIEQEEVSLHDTGTSYVINRTTYAGSLLKYKNKKFLSIKSNGLEILNIGSIRTDLAYGGERWEIQKTIVESQNIDINKIYVTYVTSETNGQSNLKINYNADLSSAVSSNANAINIVGEQVDDISKKMNDVIEYQPTPLGGSIVNVGDPHKVRVVNSYLEGFGALTVTGVASGKVILNTGIYKPQKGRTFRVGSNLIDTTVDIQVKNNGDWILAFSGTAPTYIYLDQVRLKVGD
jgi:hypothetical protein